MAPPLAGYRNAPRTGAYKVLREVPLNRAGEGVLPLIPMSLLGHSPEALQEGHVAQSLSENSQGGVVQGEVAQAGGEEARGGLGIDVDRGLSSPVA